MFHKWLQLFQKNKKDIYSAAGAVLAVVLLYLFFHLTGIGCPIHFVTGVSCPGCGMTRAAFALLRLHFADAWHYHPLIYTLPFALLLYLFRKRIPKRIYQICVFTFIALFVSIYLVRICDPTNDIVEFHPEQGFIFRTIKYFFP